MFINILNRFMVTGPTHCTDLMLFENEKVKITLRYAPAESSWWVGTNMVSDTFTEVFFLYGKVTFNSRYYEKGQSTKLIQQLENRCNAIENSAVLIVEPK